MSRGFKVGDYIEVRTEDSVLRGTAMTDHGDGIGYAYFEIKIEGTDKVLDFNSNFVGVKRLFSADVARNLGSDRPVNYHSLKVEISGNYYYITGITLVRAKFLVEALALHGVDVNPVQIEDAEGNIV